MERDPADRDPQPGAARAVFPAKFLDAPAGLVGMAQRRLVLVRKDRLGQRLEQRRTASGCRPASPARPSALGRTSTRRGARGGSRHMLEQEACPEAGPVERPGEQPRHRGRRHFHGRRRARAGPAPARTGHALVGLDLDLDEGGFLGAVRRLPSEMWIKLEECCPAGRGGRSHRAATCRAFWRRDLRRALRRSASATDSDFDNVFLTARSPASSDSSAFPSREAWQAEPPAPLSRVSNSRTERPTGTERWSSPSTSPYRLWTPPGHGAARKPRRTATGRGPRRRPVSSPPGGAEGTRWTASSRSP